MPDDRGLPASSSARQGGEQLRTDFADNLGTNVTIVLRDASDISTAEGVRYATQLSQVSAVSSVSTPDGAFVAGDRVGPPSAPTGVSDGSGFLTVTSSAPPYSEASETQLDELQAVPGPAGRHVQLTGTAAINRDTGRAVSSRLLWDKHHSAAGGLLPRPDVLDLAQGRPLGLQVQLAAGDHFE